MASTEYELLVELQARVLAQQMFMRSVLTAAFMNTSDPLGGVSEMRMDQVVAAQKANRPKGTYEDEVWEKALAAFHYELDQVAARIKEELARPIKSGSNNEVAPPVDQRADAAQFALDDA